MLNVMEFWDIEMLAYTKFYEDVFVCMKCFKGLLKRGKSLVVWELLRLSFFFISLNVSSHYAVLPLVGLIHASSIVSFYVWFFVLYIVSSSFHYCFVHRFNYLYVRTYSIYSRYRTALFFS